MDASQPVAVPGCLTVLGAYSARCSQCRQRNRQMQAIVVMGFSPLTSRRDGLKPNATRFSISSVID